MRMKLSIVVVFFTLASHLNAQNPGNRFLLKGTLEGLSNGMVYLFYTDGSKSCAEST